VTRLQPAQSHAHLQARFVWHRQAEPSQFAPTAAAHVMYVTKCHSGTLEHGTRGKTSNIAMYWTGRANVCHKWSVR
jgi:hypothetical protein